MFLISKIVRGRRLLQELEQEEQQQAIHNAAEIAAAAAGASSTLSVQLPRRSLGKSSPTNEQGSPAASSNASSNRSANGTNRRRRINRSQSHSARRRSVRAEAGEQELDGSDEEDGEGEDSDVVRTVRQATETSLPKVDDMHSSSETLAPSTVRRTSSMPTVCDLLHSPTGLRHYNYDSKLNKLQKRALRFTWHRLQTRNGGKRVENVFEEVFDRLVKQAPVLRDMFTTRAFLSAMSRNDVANLRDHSRITVKMIDVIMKNLDVDNDKRCDTGSEFDPRLIGRAHASLRPYGLTGGYWEKLGERMIDVVLAQEAVRDLPGAGLAWVVLTACIVDQLRAGFDENRGQLSMQPVKCPQSSDSNNDQCEERRPSSSTRNTVFGCPYSSPRRSSRPNAVEETAPVAAQKVSLTIR